MYIVHVHLVSSPDLIRRVYCFQYKTIRAGVGFGSGTRAGVGFGSGTHAGVGFGSGTRAGVVWDPRWGWFWVWDRD